MSRDITPTAFLDAVAAPNATPGGGSVAALAGALAAALAVMVGQLTQGKKRYAQVEVTMRRLIEEGEALRSRLTSAIARDSQAFDQVMAAYRLPRETQGERAARQNAIQAAVRGAALVPLSVARDSLAVLRLATQAATYGNPNAITDAGSAGLMARAAIGAAGLNVQINAQSVTDETLAQTWLDELSQIEIDAEVLGTELEERLLERADLQLSGIAN